MQKIATRPGSLILGKYPGVVAETSEIWAKYIQYGKERKFAKNVVFPFTTTCDCFAYIRSGSLTLSFAMPEGKQKIQLICAAKSLVNEAPIIAGYRSVSVNAICNEAASLIFFSGEMAQRELLPQHPDWRFAACRQQV